MKILFLIRSLELGGAERQLVNVAKWLNERGHGISVVTFYSSGELEKELLGASVPIYSIGKRGRWDFVRPMIRLIKLIRKKGPSVLYSCLPSENLTAVAAKPFCPFIKIVWSIQTSNMDLSPYDWFTRAIYQLQGYLASFADLIVANSYAGRDYYIARGFPKGKIEVIHNGIDTERFKPDEQARKKGRSELGIQPGEKLIGLVGRLDPVKDHPAFLKAAALLMQRRKDVRFVCVGSGPATYRDELHTMSVELGLVDRLIWVSAREDIETLYNALDLAVSSSRAEGFSNVIGEAIACGIPCVASNVGDSSLVVSSSGMIVPPCDVSALMYGMEALLARSDLYPSDILHQRIATTFSKEKFVSAVEEHLSRLLCR